MKKKRQQPTDVSYWTNYIHVVFLATIWKVSKRDFPFILAFDLFKRPPAVIYGYFMYSNIFGCFSFKLNKYHPKERTKPNDCQIKINDQLHKVKERFNVAFVSIVINIAVFYDGVFFFQINLCPCQHLLIDLSIRDRSEWQTVCSIYFLYQYELELRNVNYEHDKIRHWIQLISNNPLAH